MDRSSHFRVRVGRPPQLRHRRHDGKASDGELTLLFDGTIFGVDDDAPIPFGISRREMAGRLLAAYRRRSDDFFTRLRAQGTIVVLEPSRVLAYRSPLASHTLFYTAVDLGNHLLPVYRAARRPALSESYFLKFLLDEPSLQYDDVETPFENIRRLAPGTLVTLDGGTPQLRTVSAPRSYWYVHRPEQSLEDVAERVRELLDGAIASELGPRDTPAVCQLSGGLDSSFITALVARHTRKLSSFMYSFPTSPSHNFSEKCARQVASSLGIPLTVVTPGDLPKVTLADERPVGDEPEAYFWQGALFGPVWTRLVPEGASMFTGFGADQLFNRDPRLLSWLLRHGDLRRFRASLRFMAKDIQRSPMNLAWQSVLLLLPRDVHRRLSGPFAKWRFNPLALEELEPESILLETVPWLRRSPSAAPARKRAEAAEGRIAVEMDYLVAPFLSADPYLAPRGSRVASPYCDARLIEYVLGGVSWDLIHDWERPYKNVLREAMRGLVPEPVRMREKNEFVFDGFLADLVRKNEPFLRTFLREADLPGRDSLDTPGMMRALDELLFGLSSNSGGKLLNLVAYALWWRDFRAEAAKKERITIPRPSQRYPLPFNTPRGA